MSTTPDQQNAAQPAGQESGKARSQEEGRDEPSRDLLPRDGQEKPSEDQGENAAKPTDYLANERTFLAWLRTGIALVALGFVVARFGLLLRELATGAGVTPGTASNRISAMFGTGIVILSALFLVLSYVRYRHNDEALKHGTYTSDRFVILVVAAIVVIIAVLLAIYLLTTS